MKLSQPKTLQMIDFKKFTLYNYTNIHFPYKNCSRILYAFGKKIASAEAVILKVLLKSQLWYTYKQKNSLIINYISEINFT